MQDLASPKEYLQKEKIANTPWMPKSSWNSVKTALEISPMAARDKDSKYRARLVRVILELRVGGTG